MSYRADLEYLDQFGVTTSGSFFTQTGNVTADRLTGVSNITGPMMSSDSITGNLLYGTPGTSPTVIRTYVNDAGAILDVKRGTLGFSTFTVYNDGAIQIAPLNGLGDATIRVGIDSVYGFAFKNLNDVVLTTIHDNGVVEADGFNAPTVSADNLAPYVNSGIVTNYQLTGTRFEGKQFSTAPVAVSPSFGNVTFDWALGSVFTHKLTQNATMIFTNTTNSQSITIVVTNDTNNYTVTWPSYVSWVGGSAPVQTTGNKVDIYTIMKVGSAFFGDYVQGYNA